MDSNGSTPVKPSKVYEEAQNAAQKTLKKLEVTDNEEARKRKENLSKTRTSLSPRRKSTAMSTRSPLKPGGNLNSQLINTTINDNGELIQVFQESKNTNHVVAPVEGDAEKTQEGTTNEPSPVQELPSCPNYDPIQFVAPHRVTNILKDLDKVFNNLFFQPALPDNDVKIPSKKILNCHTYYFYSLSDSNEPYTKTRIEELGGKVVDCLESATCLIFCLSPKNPTGEDIFFFATAAAGGRFLLPVSYVSECYDAKTLLDPAEFSTEDYYYSRYDLHPSIVQAIKMSHKYRSIYAKKGNPCFYLHNVLFAEPKGEHEDVMLFLRICGAYVQPFCGIKNACTEWIGNYTITLVVNSGKVPLTDDLKNFCISTPDKIRNILLQALNQFV